MIDRNSCFMLICLAVIFLCPKSVLAERSILLRPGENIEEIFAASKPGLILELAGGDYGSLNLSRIGGAEGQPIVLRSHDVNHPAKFTGLDLREVSHVTFDQIMFDYSHSAGDSQNFRPFRIFSGRGISILGSTFDGDDKSGEGLEAEGFPTAFGLSIQSSANINLEGNEFRRFARGIVVNDAVDLKIVNNELHSMRVDGMNFSQVERVLIEDNFIHDFVRDVESSDHSDMIQFWTNGTVRPTKDVVIRGNLLNSGYGHFTQSIFMRNDLVDRGLAGDDMYYRGITIEENVIVNAHINGIVVGESEGLSIQNNTLIYNPRSKGEGDKDGVWRPSIRVAETSRKAEISRNIAHGISVSNLQSDWAMSQNIIVQDRNSQLPNYYDELFLAALTGDPRNLSSFLYLPGGPLGDSGIGASRLRQRQVSESEGIFKLAFKRPAFRTVADPKNKMAFSFDALIGSELVGVSGAAVAYSWSFSDGAKAEGSVVSHTFSAPGTYTVSVAIMLDTGEILETSSVVHAKSSLVLTYEPTSGDVISFVSPEPTRLSIASDPGAIQIGGQHPNIHIPPQMIAPFFVADRFELSVRLRALSGYKSAGEIVRIHKSLVVSLTERGGIVVDFTTPEHSRLRITTKIVPKFFRDWVDVTLRYSSEEQSFVVIADGRTIGTGKASGRTAELLYWGLSLGNPFHPERSFVGEVEAMALRVGY